MNAACEKTQEIAFVPVPLMQRTLAAMEWMIRERQWRAVQTGIECNFNESMREAMAVRDELHEIIGEIDPRLRGDDNPWRLGVLAGDRT